MTLGILGGCAWRCCRARFLLLFGRFGTAPQSSWSAMGWPVWQNLYFLRASVGDVRHFGRCQTFEGSAAWAVALKSGDAQGI